MTKPTSNAHLACPVCGQEFDNLQGKGGHLAVMKDAKHEAYRSLGKLPDQLLLPEVAQSLQPPAEVPRGSPGEVSRGSPTSTSEVQEPQGTPEPQDLDTRPSQQESDPQGEVSGIPQDLGQPPTQVPLNLASLAATEGEPQGEVYHVEFEAPPRIQPLLPESTSSGDKTKRPKVEVPLEPILAGGVAAALNGLALNKPGDGELTVEMVSTTGFPKAAEACLRHYFPDMDLDHPVVALVASGAALGVLVVSLKAPKDRQGEAQEAQAPDEPSEVEDQDLEDPEGTGNAYWDTILKQGGEV